MLLADDRRTPSEATAAAHRISPAERASAWLLGPLTAVQFLTILPIAARRTTRTHELGPAEAFFPLAGLLIGGVLVVVDRVLGAVANDTVTNVMLVATAAALTGALHLDGVIDTFDGVFAPGGPDRRLEIMRDPRAGSFGVIAVVLLLAFKLAALGSLPTGMRTVALLLGPCFGRWAIVMVTCVFPYARPQGSGRAFKDAVRPVHAIVAGAVVLTAAMLAGGALGAFVAVLVTVLALGAGRWCSARLGGLSGDTYGAICELAETLTWLVLGLHLTYSSLGGVFG